VAFSYLYPHCKKSPVDFTDLQIAHYLLKKQSLFADELCDDQYKWEYAEDDVHMMYQYTR